MLYSAPEIRAALERLRDRRRAAHAGAAAVPAVLRGHHRRGLRPGERRAAPLARGCRSCASSPTTTIIPATSTRCAPASPSTGRRTGAPRTCSSPSTASPSATCAQGDPVLQHAARPPHGCSPMSCCCAMASGASASSRASGRPAGSSPTRAPCSAGCRRAGVREVTVVCPGFAVDCLETLEEIDIENRAASCVPAASATSTCRRSTRAPAHAQCLAELIAQHCQGWTLSGSRVLPGAARGTSA